MEIKSIVKFEVQRAENLYHLLVPTGASFGETYDVIFEFLKQVTQMMQQNTQNAQQSASTNSTAPVESTPINTESEAQ